MKEITEKAIPKSCPLIKICKERVSKGHYEQFCNDSDWKYCGCVEDIIRLCEKTPQEWRDENGEDWETIL